MPPRCCSLTASSTSRRFSTRESVARRACCQSPRTRCSLGLPNLKHHARRLLRTPWLVPRGVCRCCAEAQRVSWLTEAFQGHPTVGETSPHAPPCRRSAPSSACGLLSIVPSLHPAVRVQPCCPLAPADTSRVSLYPARGRGMWRGRLDGDVVVLPSALSSSPSRVSLAGWTRLLDRPKGLPSSRPQARLPTRLHRANRRWPCASYVPSSRGARNMTISESPPRYPCAAGPRCVLRACLQALRSTA
jgi:hypothetical protein